MAWIRFWLTSLAEKENIAKYFLPAKFSTYPVGRWQPRTKCRDGGRDRADTARTQTWRAGPPMQGLQPTRESSLNLISTQKFRIQVDQILIWILIIFLAFRNRIRPNTLIRNSGDWIVVQSTADLFWNNEGAAPAFIKQNGASFLPYESAEENSRT